MSGLRSPSPDHQREPARRHRRPHPGVLAGVAAFFVLMLVVLAVIGAVRGPIIADSAPVEHVPTAPFDVVATAGDGEVRVAWHQPHDHGGSTISAYTVTATPGGSTCTWTEGPVDCTVSGLANGTAYTFAVTATNATGIGAASDPSPAVTPFGHPGAPMLVSGVAGHNAVSVRWSAPADDGGAPIDSYVVTGVSAVDAELHTCAWHSGPLECTVHGLTDGVAHTFIVVAHNAAGDGPASERSAPVAPLGVPSAPTVTTVLPLDPHSLRVAFAAGSEGDAPIDAFEVRCRPAAGGAPRTAIGATSPIDVTGLELGVTYACSVVARNSRGWSLANAATLGGPAGYRLAVGPLVDGVVRISGAADDCAGTCGADETAGVQVVLQAVPNADREFAGWTGDCAGSARACVITMDRARSVGARFEAAASGGGAETGGAASADAGGGSSAATPAAADAAVGALTLRPLSLATSVRWSRPTKRGRVTARFRATTGAAYALRAVHAGRTTAGTCRVVGANVTCVLTLRPRGVWEATLTPTIGGQATAPTRKRLRV